MMNPTNPSSSAGRKFDMKVNPAYQIEMTTTTSGKRVAATKRRVRFRFGFSNRDALIKGLTGNEARGEEHEVALIWSLTSGKRIVVLDGQEVHYSMGRRGDSKFETTWPIAGGHNLSIIAHAAPPIRSTPGSSQQFDLLFDGVSFFDLPRIFELGVRRQPVAHAVDPTAHGQNKSFAYPNNSGYHQEEARRRSSAFDIPGEVRSTSNYATQQGGMSGPVRRATMEAIPTAPLIKDVLIEAAPTPTVTTFNDSQSTLTSVSSGVDEYAPRPPQPPTYQQVSNQILSAYGAPPPAQAPAAAPTIRAPQAVPQQVQTLPAPTATAPYPTQQIQAHAFQPVMVSPDSTAAASSGGFTYPQEVAPAAPPKPELAVETPPPSSPVAAAAPAVTPTMTMMKPLEVDELRDSPPPASTNPVDQAFHNLVNLNNIFETRSSPEEIRARQQKELNKKMELKGRPVAPVATTWQVGKGASLADIQKHKTPVAPSTKEVMKANAFDPAAAQAGMMVVYGQQPPQVAGGYAGGMPPPTGFGAGQMYNRGYTQPVRSAY